MMTAMQKVQELHMTCLSFEGLFGEQAWAPDVDGGLGSLIFKRDGDGVMLTVNVDGEKWPYRVRLTQGDVHFLKLWLNEEAV